MPPINNFNPYQQNPQAWAAPNAYQQPIYTAQPYQPPIQQRQPDMIWVQGEAGAKAYMVAPNTRVVLWDQDNPVIYIKQADASGMTNMRVLDYIERGSQQQTDNHGAIKVDPEYVTRDDLTALEDKFQRQINRLNSQVNNMRNKGGSNNGE